MKKLITSALPYVNNVPHLGNIIGCVLSADVYARFCRSRGYETLYVCGTDEYGTATENKAREEGLTPRQVCDKYHAIHCRIYKDFNISFDVFGRTSTEEQKEVAQSIFNDLDAHGLIFDKAEHRTYCEKDAMFLADRYVEGTCPHCKYEDARGDQCDQCQRLLDPESLVHPRCKICGTPPVLKETRHLFLDLEKLQPELTTWFAEAHKTGAWTNNAIQTTQSWLEKGLQPRPITRDLKWGIPVPKPGFEDKVFYVWFDAPIGYISITAKAFENWKNWWFSPDDTQLYQFMAKDNIPFHTVIFPSSLLGSGKNWTLLHHINSTEYLNYENTKFSKSRHIGVFGTDVNQTDIPIDLWRFYLLFNRPEKNDSSFSWHDFYEKCNSEFIDNIGNLVNRALVYLNKNFDSVLGPDTWPEDHQAFADACMGDFKAITQALEEVKLREGLRQILALGRRSNKFFQDAVPWEHIKTDPARALATVTVLAYVVRALSVFLEPYMPGTAKRLQTMLNLEGLDWQTVSCFSGMAGHRIAAPEILFPKLDLKQAEKYRVKFSGEGPDFGDFQLKIGQITAVDAHPSADKLYKLKVEVGEDQPRQVVAGLVNHYTPEELLQRNVVLLANLQKADIRGETSEGMLLVCEKRKQMELLEAEGLPIGSIAEVAEQNIKHEEISSDKFKSAPFKVEEGRLLFDNQEVLVNGNNIRSKTLQNGKVR